MSIVKAFNSHFIEFIEDIQRVLPTDKNIKTVKFYTTQIIKLNPLLLIKSWGLWVVEPYTAQINSGDFTFFISKDYEKDIGKSAHYNSDSVLNAIDLIRNEASIMSEDNQKKIIKYVQNLSKLSNMYNA